MDWSEDLMTGVKSVDDQHKEIIERLTILLQSSEAQQKELIESNIDFLADYILVHFNSEERLQKSADYPNYAAHKAEHETFISRFTSLRNAYARSHASAEDIKELIGFAGEWLFHHIKVTDMAFASYYKTYRQP